MGGHDVVPIAHSVQAIDHNGKSRQELEISNPDFGLMRLTTHCAVESDGVSIENEVTSDRGSNE